MRCTDIDRWAAASLVRVAPTQRPVLRATCLCISDLTISLRVYMQREYVRRRKQPYALLARARRQDSLSGWDCSRL